MRRILPTLMTSVMAFSGCAVVGYPSGASAPGGARATEPQRAEPGPTGGDIPDAIPVDEPRSVYGNPAEYEVFGVTYKVMDSADGYDETGLASWYGEEFQGRRTSSGEPYDMNAMTAAHRTLPLPTYVEVTNLENSRVAVVRVNDRGPFHAERLIDLSYAAALKLGVVGPGTARVRVRTLEPTPR